MKFLIAMLMVGVVLADDGRYDPIAVLKRSREKVIQAVERVRNYTCVETVERKVFQPAAAQLPRQCPVILQQRQHPTPDLVLRPAWADRLRLDVTLTGRGEIFSWVGAAKFANEDISQLVRTGRIRHRQLWGLLERSLRERQESVCLRTDHVP